MYRITQEIDFCYGHRLLKHAGKCRHLHGHNGRAVVVLQGPDLDQQGMLLDFSEIKQRLRGWIDDHLDHRMLLFEDDPIVPILQQHGEALFLMDSHPTAENLARLLFEQARVLELPVVEVTLWETCHCSATYSPVA